MALSAVRKFRDFDGHLNGWWDTFKSLQGDFNKYEIMSNAINNLY